MKRNKKLALVVALVVVVLTVAGVWAAWQITRQTQTTAMVVGTFTLDNLVCDNAVEGEQAACSAQVTNLYDLEMQISAASMVADRGDVTTGAVSVNGAIPTSYPVTVAPGATADLIASWTPSAGAAIGEVQFTLEVVAQAD